MNGLGLCYKSYWLRDHFLLVAMSDHTTGSRNIKPEVVFKVQKVARYASFCLIMGPFKGEVPVFALLWPIRVRVGVSFTTGAVWLAILATAGLLVGFTLTVCVSLAAIGSSRLSWICCWWHQQAYFSTEIGVSCFREKTTVTGTQSCYNRSQISKSAEKSQWWQVLHDSIYIFWFSLFISICKYYRNMQLSSVF